MDIQQTLLYLVIIGVAYAMFVAYRAKNRIYCTFTRRDRTKGHKWAKAKNGERVEFEGGWYYVRFNRVTLEAIDSGFNMLLPTMVRCLDFRYSSPEPIDHKTGENNFETPEIRKSLNAREDVEALDLGSKKAFGKVQKAGILGGGWMPIIIVLGIVVAIYMIIQQNQRIDMIGNGMNVLQEMIDKIK